MGAMVAHGHTGTVSYPPPHAIHPDSNPNPPTAIPLQALHTGLSTASAFLTYTKVSTHEYATATPSLNPNPDGSYIISHLKKDKSSQTTNCVLSLSNINAYAMLATLHTQVKVKLPTTVTIAGAHHQQILHIHLNPHKRSIMSRAYLSLFQNPFTQSMNTLVPILQTHPTKGVTCRRIDKLEWADTLLYAPSTFAAYEEYARESALVVDDKPPDYPNSTHKRQRYDIPPGSPSACNTRNTHPM